MQILALTISVFQLRTIYYGKYFWKMKKENSKFGQWTTFQLSDPLMRTALYHKTLRVRLCKERTASPSLF